MYKNESLRKGHYELKYELNETRSQEHPLVFARHDTVFAFAAAVVLDVLIKLRIKRTVDRTVMILWADVLKLFLALQHRFKRFDILKHVCFITQQQDLVEGKKLCHEPSWPGIDPKVELKIVFELDVFSVLDNK